MEILNLNLSLNIKKLDLIIINSQQKYKDNLLHLDEHSLVELHKLKRIQNYYGSLKYFRKFTNS